jgi:PTH1 family peptidyl-tRNA hydrolase
VKLIVGLGNPGRQYQFTKHNMGFLVIDQSAQRHDISLGQGGFDAHFGKGKIGGNAVLFAKPQTFMNLSGVAVRKLAEYFKINIEDLIVIHDDLSRIRHGCGLRR